ncbi:mercury(II) reductase [Chelativorans intermedius]|uniref:Mercuric reductase n=1 Tax=Chelativorans intermedius TaxID=515947 RepID=A0ABV6DAV0_9HYPH|nr:mercury(II) reductase [Chelativorans intermedius]
MSDLVARNRRKGQRRAYDLAVVGAGSAGFSAAIAAAERGANVALIGHGTIGGTCVNIGCVPSKTMIRAAQALHDTRAVMRFPGLVGEADLADWPALAAAKDDLVGALRKTKYLDLLSSYERIAYLEGWASFHGGSLLVDGVAIRADRIVIATGASPARPDIAGIDDIPFLDSTSALALQALPRSLLVVGGGYVGCELAQMFARMGVRVTLATRSRLLPEAEPEVSAALADFLRAEGLAVRQHLAYRNLGRTADGVALAIGSEKGTETLVAERILFATGRRPNTAGMHLAEAGIRLDDRGAIVVDARLRTTRPHTYAAGDVTGRDQFVYMAAHGAKLAALNALEGDAHIYDNSAMPWVVFTDPQVAGVGLTEATARTSGRAVRTSLVPLDHVPRALAARDTRGLVKLVADGDSGRLLGGQIVAPEGADSIQTLTLAIRHAMTAKELGETIFPYLTTVEAWKLAAQAFEKDVTRLSCCAG